MKPSEHLRRAKTVLEQPGAWTQCAIARDADDAPCPFDAPVAVCFCGEGALLKTGDPTLYTQSLIYLQRATHTFAFWVWQDKDSREKHEVLGAFDAAAELAESEGQ